jgi:hypothetical protein
MNEVGGNTQIQFTNLAIGNNGIMESPATSMG